MSSTTAALIAHFDAIAEHYRLATESLRKLLKKTDEASGGAPSRRHPATGSGGDIPWWTGPLPPWAQGSAIAPPVEPTPDNNPNGGG